MVSLLDRALTVANTVDNHSPFGMIRQHVGLDPRRFTRYFIIYRGGSDLTPRWSGSVCQRVAASSVFSSLRWRSPSQTAVISGTSGIPSAVFWSVIRTSPPREIGALDAVSAAWSGGWCESPEGAGIGRSVESAWLRASLCSLPSPVES